MAKYVFDFDTIGTTSNNIESKYEEILSDLSAYEKDLKTTLNGWSSISKEEFISKHNSMVSSLKNCLTNIEKVQQYLVGLSDKINAAESSISSSNIM